MCEGGGRSGTERTLSVRAAEDPLSDISGSRAYAIEVASTADAAVTQQRANNDYIHTVGILRFAVLR